ncbi:MAG: ISAs1 family transposase [Bacteroidota bacterium]
MMLLDHFADLDDPRSGNATRHKLADILAVALCATLAGADGFADMERFGTAKRAWFERWLDLPGGIPSHDTFGRVFAALDAERFAACFAAWTRSVAEVTDGEVVALDGKTVRGSASADGRALQVVSAWATQNRLVLAHMPVPEHSNEAATLPAVLALLDVRGCLVTIDAAGCYPETAQRVLDGSADYVLALKANQPTLHDEVASLFERAGNESERDLRRALRPLTGYAEHTDGGHGRVEIRRCHALDVAETGLIDAPAWPGLRSVAMVESERHVSGGDTVSVERRYYVSSLPVDAERVLAAVRSHWGIENGQHWVLDVVFSEDLSAIRHRVAATNAATLRRLALGVLSDDTLRDSLRGKRQRAGWDEEYLARLIGLQMR